MTQVAIEITRERELSGDSTVKSVIDEVEFLKRLALNVAEHDESGVEDSEFIQESFKKMSSPELRSFANDRIRAAMNDRSMEEMRKLFEESQRENSIPDEYNNKDIDPLRLLMLAIMETEQKELELQGAVANTLKGLAVAVQKNVLQGNKMIEEKLKALNDPNDHTEISIKNSNYTAASQKVSSNNNTMNNTLQGVQTTVTGLSHTLAQILEYGKTVLDNSAALNNMLSRFG